MIRFAQALFSGTQARKIDIFGRAAEELPNAQCGVAVELYARVRAREGTANTLQFYYSHAESHA